MRVELDGKIFDAVPNGLGYDISAFVLSDDVTVVPEVGMRVLLKEDIIPGYIRGMANEKGRVRTITRVEDDVFYVKETDWAYHAEWIDYIMGEEQLFAQLLDTSNYIFQGKFLGKIFPAKREGDGYMLTLPRMSGGYHELIFYGDEIKLFEPGSVVTLKPIEECELDYYTTDEMKKLFGKDVTVRTISNLREIIFRIEGLEGNFKSDWVEKIK